MKKITLLTIFYLFCSLNLYSQKQIIFGDFNQDGQLTIADDTLLTKAILGQDKIKEVLVDGDGNISLVDIKNPGDIGYEFETEGLKYRILSTTPYLYK